MTTKPSKKECKVLGNRKVTRGEYNRLRKAVAARRAKLTRSAVFEYEMPPVMPPYEDNDPCMYPIYWANYAWLEMMDAIIDALAVYEGFRLTAVACIDSHQV